MSHHIPKKTKVYRPEINECPFCHAKLKYRYSVSNKVIQFSDGSCTRIKNLGYSCSNPECKHAEILYTSQTANKFCVKGYTYSAHILAYIVYYKLKNYSRDAICDNLALSGIEISDRNVDNINAYYGSMLQYDYLKNIDIEYNYMQKEYGQVMISIDSIKIDNEVFFFSIRNFFSGSQIGLHVLEIKDLNYNFLEPYLDEKYNITVIALPRSITPLYQAVKSIIKNRDIKLIEFLKI